MQVLSSRKPVAYATLLGVDEGEVTAQCHAEWQCSEERPDDELDKKDETRKALQDTEGASLFWAAHRL